MQLLQQEALAASPRVRPFPRTIYSSAPSPPLSRRSPPPSRPVSALAPGGAASAAAAQLAAGMGGQEGRSAAYWRRFGLGAEPDFAGFLERQHKFARVSLADLLEVLGCQGLAAVLGRAFCSLQGPLLL